MIIFILEAHIIARWYMATLISNVIFRFASNGQSVHPVCGGRARTEANLQWTSTVMAQYLLQMHNKKKFYLENEGQSEWAQHPQWCHTTAIIKRYTFWAGFHIFGILAFHIFYLENLGQGHGVQHSQMSHDGEYNMNVDKSHNWAFFASSSSLSFSDISISNFVTWKM